MKPFIHEDFLLENSVAAELYHRYAEPLPIFDYHCHLSPQWMAEDHRFQSLTEIWLAGDHYKWRALRANGVPERLITGSDASDWEKFGAWARTVPRTLRNPLYHWTHMELAKPFGIHELLSEKTAKKVYDLAGMRLSEKGFSAMGLLEQFKVAAVFTTDDPADSLEFHDMLAQRPDPATRVYPTWRPDQAVRMESPGAWNAWVNRLEAASGVAVGSLDSFLAALENRHAFFHERGCRTSDHGLERMDAESWSDDDVSGVFNRMRSGKDPGEREAAKLRSALLHRLAILDHGRGWVQQFHLGALRNNNRRLGKLAGPDVGCDSIGDWDQARPLSRFLDKLDSTRQLAKTILFNLNPSDNEVFAALCGNFQDDSTPGKMQYGPAWWFLDQWDGMESQLKSLSNLGLLSRFVGMVTDSRSFLSYSRHEYFRRLLCNLLGQDVTQGRLPDDRDLLGGMVRDVCFFNAVDYFNRPPGKAGQGVSRSERKQF